MVKIYQRQRLKHSSCKYLAAVIQYLIFKKIMLQLTQDREIAVLIKKKRKKKIKNYFLFRVKIFQQE